MLRVRKQSTYAFALVAGCVLSGAAFAADVVIPPPVVPPPPAAIKPANPWHGFYVGGAGGYAWGRIDGHAHIDISNNPSEDYYPSFDAQSWLASGLVGVDAQFGNHVIGIFADYTWLNDFSGEETINPSGTFYKSFAADIDSIATVAGRIGIVHNTNSLIYALGGWSWAKGSLSEFEGCDPGFCDNLEYSGSVTANGWTAGGGIEHLFGKHLSGRLEYRYTHLNTSSISGNCTPQNSNCGASYYGTASASANIHSVRAALVLRFGGN